MVSSRLPNIAEAAVAVSAFAVPASASAWAEGSVGMRREVLRWRKVKGNIETTTV